jgi:5'-nucleotidase
MGSRHVLPGWPDVVISGVNKGRNVAEDVVYSGTIAGALEGTILGLPSFALSQEFGGKENRDKPMWDVARKYGADVIRKVMKLGVPPDTVININFPACRPEEVKGIVVARQGKRNQGFLRIDGREDGRGNPYYWIGFQMFEKLEPPGEGTDLAALEANFVSVTPLRLDRTDVTFAEELKKVF